MSGSGGVAAIVLNWRRPDLTIACARRLAAIPEVDRILVLDNGSGTDELRAIRDGLQDLARVSVSATSTNLGYAGGMQFGIRTVMAADPEFIWLVNNDCSLEPGSLAPLLQEMSDHPRTAACSGMVRQITPTGEWWHGGGKVGYVRGRMINMYSEERSRADRYVVEYVPGVAWLLRTSAIAEVGGLDARLFLFGEEPDWCARAGRLGYQAVMVPAASFRALQSATVGAYVCEIAYYGARNTAWLVRRRGDAWLRARHHAALLLFHIPKRLLGLAIRGEARCARSFLLGCWHGLVRSAEWSDDPNDALGSRLPAFAGTDRRSGTRLRD